MILGTKLSFDTLANAIILVVSSGYIRIFYLNGNCMCLLITGWISRELLDWDKGRFSSI